MSASRIVLYIASTLALLCAFLGGASIARAGHGTSALCNVCIADQWIYPFPEKHLKVLTAIYDGNFGIPCVSNGQTIVEFLAFTDSQDFIRIGAQRNEVSDDWYAYASCNQCTGEMPQRLLQNGDRFWLEYLPDTGAGGIWNAWIKHANGPWDLLLQRAGMGGYATRMGVLGATSNWNNDMGVSVIKGISVLDEYLSPPLNTPTVQWRSWKPFNGYGRFYYYWISSEQSGRYISYASPNGKVTYLSDHHELPAPQTDACGGTIK